MTVNVLFAANPSDWDDYAGRLPGACRALGVEIDLSRDHTPEAVDYIVLAPSGPVQDFTPFTRTRAVLNLWAGVEAVVGNATLTQPLCRMVDPGMTEGMVEWVTGHVLRHHLGTDTHVLGQDGIWREKAPPLARSRRVGMLGLGELGTACARALAALNFDVAGWSRREKLLPGIATHHGAAGLDAVLARSDILVLLVPLTADTEGLMGPERIARLPQGAVIVNPGRGPLIDDDALIAALDAGHLSHATLDVFRQEPLQPEHPFWAHPRVTVTPHIASTTRPETATGVIAENIRRGEAGEPLLHLVDRGAGY